MKTAPGVIETAGVKDGVEGGAEGSVSGCCFIVSLSDRGAQRGSPQAQRSLMQTCRSAAFVTVASFLLPHVL